MNSIDFRNETFESLQSRLTGLRLMILDAWRAHGRMTTRELAARAGLDLLTVRPRTTELLEMGFLRLVDRRDHEGVYEALTEAEARSAFAALTCRRETQSELPLC